MVVLQLNILHLNPAVKTQIKEVCCSLHDVLFISAAFLCNHLEPLELCLPTNHKQVKLIVFIFFIQQKLYQ